MVYFKNEILFHKNIKYTYQNSFVKTKSRNKNTYLKEYCSVNILKKVTQLLKNTRHNTFIEYFVLDFYIYSYKTTNFYNIQQYIYCTR